MKSPRAPEPLAAPRGVATPQTRTVWALLMADVLLWALMALLEQNIAIVLVHLGMLGLVWAVVGRMHPGVALPFSAGLLLRGLAAALAWVFASDPERRFYIGTNEDAFRYWGASLLSYADAAEYFEDPLFALVNVFVTRLTSWVAEPAYLATFQTTLFAGALMVAFTHLLARELYGDRVARPTAWLMALSPIAIVFSSGLMRDALIGMFGLTFMLGLWRMSNAEQAQRQVAYLALTVASALALSLLRSISLAGFVFAGLALVMLGTQHRPSAMSVRARLALLGLMALVVLYAVWARPDRFEVDNILSHAVASRSGESLEHGTSVDPDGLTSRLFDISPLMFVLISPLALLQPLPFFSWNPPDFMDGPPALMDMAIGFGALMNQLLFGLYLVGIRLWFSTRDRGGLAAGAFYTLGICTLTLIGLGQIRMVMAHTYFFFFLGATLAALALLRTGGRQLLRQQLLSWWAVMAAMYGGYLSHKHLGSLPLVALCGVLTVALFVRFWRQWPTGRLRPHRSLTDAMTDRTASSPKP